MVQHILSFPADTSKIYVQSLLHDPAKVSQPLQKQENTHQKTCVWAPVARTCSFQRNHRSGGRAGEVGLAVRKHLLLEVWIFKVQLLLQAVQSFNRSGTEWPGIAPKEKHAEEFETGWFGLSQNPSYFGETGHPGGGSSSRPSVLPKTQLHTQRIPQTVLRSRLHIQDLTSLVPRVMMKSPSQKRISSPSRIV